MRPNVAPVLVYLLKLIQSEQTFHRIAKRIPAVFKQIVSTSTAAEARHLHEVVELLRHLLHRYPIHNESQRKEIVRGDCGKTIARDFNASNFHFRNLRFQTIAIRRISQNRNLVTLWSLGIPKCQSDWSTWETRAT